MALKAATQFRDYFNNFSAAAGSKVSVSAAVVVDAAAAVADAPVAAVSEPVEYSAANYSTHPQLIGETGPLGQFFRVYEFQSQSPLMETLSC